MTARCPACASLETEAHLGPQGYPEVGDRADWTCVDCDAEFVACVPEPASVEFDDALAAGCDVVEGWR
jgi:hypothetical protein